MDITASIVLYKNNAQYIKDLISWFYNTQLNVKLYLIDNSPTPEIKSKLDLSKTEYIFNSKNIGFGAAHNIILKNKEKLGTYHIIINPDIIVKDNILEKLYLFMKENLDIGFLMPKINYPDGNIQFLPKNLPTPIDLFIRNTPFSKKIKDKINNKYELRTLDHNKSFSPQIISGCFGVLRAELINKYNLFYDERFFMYFEDFDLSRRFKKVSKLLYYHDIEVIHEYERGARKNIKLFFIFILSMIKYFNKWGWIWDKERKNNIEI